MNLENEILICYDIQENKRRNKCYEELKNIGCIPVQKSVMWGMLQQSERKAAQRILKQYCEKTTDKAFLVQAKVSDSIVKDGIGYEKEDFEFYKREFMLI